MKKILLFGILTSLIHLNYAQFGMDIIINDQPTIDQRNVRLATAFNGWLYSAYCTVDSANNSGGITIRKSVDKGVTWTTIDSYSPTNIRYEDVEIVVAGTDTNNLTLFLAAIRHNLGTDEYVTFIDRYDGRTGVFIGSNFNKNTGTRKTYDLSLASDYEYPGVSASPYSVGLLMSEYTPIRDSIIYFGSIDGGASFSVKAVVATTGGYFNKVSISYGRSNSGSNGRYFAAWEQRSTSTSRNGHIYTSRSQSQVNSTTWINPVCLDSVSTSMINLCRNPRIATQYNNVDTDSGGVAAVVLVDRDYNGDASDYDLLGFYNKRAHFTNYWSRLDVRNNSQSDMHADIVFDAISNNFHAVFFDSTAQDLNYVTNGFNLTTPSSWNFVNPQFNDTTVLTNAYPRISFNQAEAAIGAVWNKAGIGTKGVSMFDADYTVLFVGLTEENKPILGINAYPNPVTDYLTVDLQNTESASLKILNANGQLLEIINVINDQQVISLTPYPSGVYFIEFEHNGEVLTKKIIKN